MRKIAVYRIHYGLDFLGKSIDSLYLHVDKVFVFWSKQPWYKDCKNLPHMNENVAEFCKKYYGWGDNKVTVFEREYDLPDNQFKKMLSSTLASILGVSPSTDLIRVPLPPANIIIPNDIKLIL